jgi:hypothetical protein
MMLADDLLPLLRRLAVLPRLLVLDTPGVRASVPMLRGVWGAALHGLDPEAYAAVFAPPTPNTPVGYLLRPAPPGPHDAPGLHWFLFGDACRREEVLRRAWDVASGMGLGPQRRRWFVRRWTTLGPDGQESGDSRPWTLDAVRWPLAPDAPCRLHFPAPLRLLRRGRLLEQPTLADLAVAAGRRIAALLPEADRPCWEALAPAILALARGRPAGPWQGARLDLVRWSARQQSDVDLHGLSGVLPLPAGPGDLWPLLAAASWLHLGKGSAIGLGQLCILTGAAGEGTISLGRLREGRVR